MKSALNRGHHGPQVRPLEMDDENIVEYFGCIRILVLIFDVAVMIYNTSNDSNTKGYHGTVLALLMDIIMDMEYLLRTSFWVVLRVLSIDLIFGSQVGEFCHSPYDGFGAWDKTQ